MKNNRKLCPSSRLTKGASLLGIRNDEGKMDILEEPLLITKELYNQFQAHDTAPEKALRFTNKCIQSGCKQWTGSKCGVIENILEKVERKFMKDQLPSCAIRNPCRWHNQRGPEACKVCPLVTTYLEHPTHDKFIDH